MFTDYIFGAWSNAKKRRFRAPRNSGSMSNTGPTPRVRRPLCAKLRNKGEIRRGPGITHPLKGRRKLQNGVMAGVHEASYRRQFLRAGRRRRKIPCAREIIHRDGNYMEISGRFTRFIRNVRIFHCIPNSRANQLSSDCTNAINLNNKRNFQSWRRKIYEDAFILNINLYNFWQLTLINFTFRNDTSFSPVSDVVAQHGCCIEYKMAFSYLAVFVHVVVRQLHLLEGNNLLP